MNQHDESSSTTWPMNLPAGERANAVSHGIGCLLSVVGACVLMIHAIRSGSVWSMVGCAIFALSLVAVYAASTLSHSFSEPKLRQLFRSIDQASIYLLIAGTYTPFSLVYLRHGWWWLLLAMMWLVAIHGCISKLIYSRHTKSLAIWPYVLLGWLPILAAIYLVNVVPPVALWWMLAGGVCYTVGTLFLIWDYRHIHFHAIWHTLVMCGSTLHYFAILLFVSQERTIG